MGRVGEELTQPLLASAAIGEGMLDLGEHLVQRRAKTADLGAVVGGSDPLGEVAVGDLARDSPDPLQRPQADTDHDPAQCNEPEDHAAAHERLDLDQPLERLVDVVKRNRDHERPAVLERERGGAVGQARSRLRADREQV